MILVESYRLQPNSPKEIKDILIDDNLDNDQLVCELIDSDDENTISNIREIFNC